MSLKTRKTIILAKVESVYGTDAVPTGSANAMLVSNPQIQPLAGDTVSRNFARPYLGNSGAIHVGSHVQCTFDVEVAGGGAAGTAPPWGELLKGCGMAETIDAGVNVEYDPVSTGEDSLTIHFHLDGQKHAMTGARGSFSMAFNKNSIPMLSFSFVGLWVDPATAADPTPDFSNFQSPIPISNDNTPTATLHGYAGVLEGLSIDMGVNAVHSDRPNQEDVIITDRSPSGSISFVAPALSTKNWYTIAKANTTGAIQLIHGITAGNIVQIDSATTQLLSPTYGDVNGEVLIQSNLAFIPTSAGNDEIKISVS